MTWLVSILAKWFTPKPDPRPPAPKPSGTLVEEINKHRVSRNMPPLNASAQLTAASQKHANWMDAVDRMSHTGDYGSTPGGRIRDEGYRAVAWAENVAWGQQTAAGVVISWAGSPGHNHNMLGAFAEIGVGRSGDYWCAVFATPREDA